MITNDQKKKIALFIKNPTLAFVEQLYNSIYSKLKKELLAVIMRIELPRGEKGEKGEPGQAIVGEKGDRGEQGEPGKDGYTPKKGLDYFDGAPGKDGHTPVKGVDYFDGKDASISAKELSSFIDSILTDRLPEKFISEKDVEKILGKKKFSVKNLSDLEKRLNVLRADVMRNYGGHGGHISYFDLSPLLDGITTTFTIPANNRILLITSSSTPFNFRQSVDFTGGGTTTLTFTAAVDAPSMLASGQTITMLYV